MALAPTRQPYRFTVEEYLAFERASEERHEYLDGVIYAMAGSASTQAMAGESEDHGTICMNLAISLGLSSVAHPVAPSVRIRRCAVARIVPTRAKGSMPTPIWWSCVAPASTTTRPGMSCSIRRSLWKCCPPRRRPSTGATSCHRYRRWLPTLTDYVLVAQDRPVIDHYHRTPTGAPALETGGSWRPSKASTPTCTCPASHCTVPLAEVYERIVFPQAEGEPTP